MNTAGPTPGRGPAEAQAAGASRSRQALSVHFVAFDVDAKVFAPVKKLGATVVGAADEKQLNTQLEFILQRKILLEEEEAGEEEVTSKANRKKYLCSERSNGCSSGWA